MAKIAGSVLSVPAAARNGFYHTKITVQKTAQILYLTAFTGVCVVIPYHARACVLYNKKGAFQPPFLSCFMTTLQQIQITMPKIHTKSTYQPFAIHTKSK